MLLKQRVSLILRTYEMKASNREVLMLCCDETERR